MPFPARTSPKTTCLPSRWGVGTVVTKNYMKRQEALKMLCTGDWYTCEPLVPSHRSAQTLVPSCQAKALELTRSRIRHAQQEWLRVLQLKVLVFKLLPIDALSSRSISTGEVSTLDHERLDHTVEDGALVMERLAGLALALFARAESAEIVGSFGDHIVVLEGGGSEAENSV